jgi:hypothetical protein
MEQRFPVVRHSSCWSRNRPIFRMRMRRKQLRTLGHPLLLVIVKPVLTWFEAGNNRMPRVRPLSPPNSPAIGLGTLHQALSHRKPGSDCFSRQPTLQLDDGIDDASIGEAFGIEYASLYAR